MGGRDGIIINYCIFDYFGVFWASEQCVFGLMVYSRYSTQALTLFSLKLLRGCVRMGTSHTFTIKHISGYGRGIVYSTFPLRSLLIIYRGNVRFKRSSYISQNG